MKLKVINSRKEKRETMRRNFWSEVKNSYTTEGDGDRGVKKATHIDAWKTDDDNEEGEVIAKVILTTNNDIVVVYIDNLARDDEQAQEKINEAVSDFEKEIADLVRVGIYYENQKYIAKKMDNFNIENPSLISVAFEEETANFIANSFNNDMYENG